MQLGQFSQLGVVQQLSQLGQLVQVGTVQLGHVGAVQLGQPSQLQHVQSSHEKKYRLKILMNSILILYPEQAPPSPTVKASNHVLHILAFTGTLTRENTAYYPLSENKSPIGVDEKIRE